MRRVVALVLGVRFRLSRAFGVQQICWLAGWLMNANGGHFGRPDALFVFLLAQTLEILILIHK